ncbi:MAG: hypothetical protein COA73_06175 [Candidatus Hydrogenedentota bacterium]|nr:MAG: hypothetical protein COA73_06175 [Candidatus Hydrogenedentota bacterium]
MSKSVLSTCTAALITALALIPGLTPAHAEDPVATLLDTSEAESYIGLWKLFVTVEALGGMEMELFLNVADVEGKIGATLDTADQPEPLAIMSILADEENEGGLNMNSVLNFRGTFSIDINLRVQRDGEGLTGRIRASGGLLDAEITGERMSADELDSVQGQRPAPTEARMIVNGKRVRIAFADLEMGETDWDAFQNVEDGDVFKFTTSRATKIYTDMDLKFGDTVIKKENMAPDYPGVYSLWLRKVGDGWNLIFNDQSDIWGSRRLAEHDVAEIPLTVNTTSGDPQQKFLITLVQEGDTDAAALTMAWGNLQLSAQCGLIQ